MAEARPGGSESHPDGEQRRRRVVVAITLLVGTGLLGVSFATSPGQPAFYPASIALALAWTVGAVASGPLRLGRIEFRGAQRRPVLVPIGVGGLLAGVFAAAAVMIRDVPVLSGLIEDVIGYARYGAFPLVLAITIANGIAEELFFRGALFASIGRWHPVLISTVLYALTTIGTGNPMLVLAAAVLGAVTALQRRATAGVLAPILTHVTWSTTMLLVLPSIL